MESKVKITAIFSCTLERAFKTPILCDVTKIHTGFGLMPKVIDNTDDKDWGQIGSSKKVFVEKSLTHKGGFGSVDNVIERIENKYWKIEVNNFQAWMLGFYKFVGEWKTSELERELILIEYTYTLHSKNFILYPINWLFTKIFWKIYMNHVMENVRCLTINNEPYQFK
jgi:hypothetical protein